MQGLWMNCLTSWMCQIRLPIQILKLLQVMVQTVMLTLVKLITFKNFNLSYVMPVHNHYLLNWKTAYKGKACKL